MTKPVIPLFTVPKSAAQAREMQDELRGYLRLQNGFGVIETIAGVDVGYDPAQDLAFASVAVVRFPDLALLERVRVSEPVHFPYIPGLLSFREIPVLLNAIAQLSEVPDLFMVDGQGIAHPRRMGIATHLGILLDMPSIGVAKSRLTGDFKEPAAEKGSASPLMAGDEQIGVVLRSKQRSNPLFISPGHRIDMPTAVEITMQCLTKYRLPEPTRLADKYSKKEKEERAA